MPERLSVLILGVILSGGFTAAGGDSARLTPIEAAGRLRQGIPVYSCAARPDRFFGVRGRCPGSTDPARVEEIRDGKAVFGRGSRAAGAERDRNTMEDDL
jgi:hypothetical protein